MLIGLLILLIILWALGILPSNINIPNIILFTINGRDITLWNLITLIVISWIIGIIPYPFRAIASILLVLWILSILGILTIAGLSNWLVLVIIVGLVFYLILGVMQKTVV